MPEVPQTEYDRRVERARSLMARHGIDALVVTDAVNYYYFAGHKPPGGLRSRPFIFILPLEGPPAIRSWSGPEALARCCHRPFPSWVEDRELYPDLPLTTESTVDWGIREELEDRKVDTGTIAMELGAETWLGIPVNDLLQLQRELPKARFVESGPVVWGCRKIKSAWEIDCAKRACDLGGKAWQRALRDLKIGDSTLEFKKTIYRNYAEEGLDLDFCPLRSLAPAVQEERSRREMPSISIPDHPTSGTRWILLGALSSASRANASSPNAPSCGNLLARSCSA